MSRWHCAHESTELRAMRTTTGIQYRMQCQICGRSAGNAISHEKVKVFPPEWDALLEARWEEGVRAAVAADRAEAEGKMSAAALERRESYQRYLASTEWQERRRLALQRDRNVCQGCHRARAVEVHHLTYEHIGKELLYELVSLCRECHETAHSERPPLDA